MEWGWVEWGGVGWGGVVWGEVEVGLAWGCSEGLDAAAGVSSVCVDGQWGPLFSGARVREQ